MKYIRPLFFTHRNNYHIQYLRECLDLQHIRDFLVEFGYSILVAFCIAIPESSLASAFVVVSMVAVVRRKREIHSIHSCLPNQNDNNQNYYLHQ